MKTNTAITDSSSHTFLAGAIVVANLDYAALSAYGLRMIIGGAIWMIFKLAGDYLSHRMLTKAKNKKEESEQNEEGKED